MNHFHRFAAVIAVAALLGQGCARPPAIPDTSGRPADTRPIAAGSCSNAYYPFTPNTSILYGMTGGTATSDFTMAVLDSGTAGTHKMEYTFNVRGTENKISQEFSCEGGTIRAKGYLDFASAFAQGISFETKSVSGEFLPEDLSTGKKWEMTIQSVVRTDNPQLKSLLDGKEQNMNISSEVLGEESVTVPAGTFTAKKIKQTIDTRSAMMPGSIIIDQTIWLVRDIGLVKSEVRSRGALSSTMVAKEINR